MATTASILSVLVNADTATATAKLSQFDRQMEQTRAKTRTALKATLGGEFNDSAFAKYDARLAQTQRKISDRAKFKAALGGDFNPAAFTAYERAIDRAQVSTAQADTTTRRFAASTTNADTAARRLSTGISSVGSRLVGFASNFATVGFAIGAAGAASVHAGTDFQRSMEMILGVAGTTQKQVDALSKSVLSLSGSTATAPDELAKGLFHLTAQGLQGAKAMDALAVAAKGAKIGQANLEDVTNALGAAVASQVKGTSNLQNAMQSMITTVKTGDMTMQQLAEAYGTGLLGPMKQFGVNLQDINAALAVFGDNNIRGADAGTKLGSAIRIMAAPSKAASKELATIGLSATGLADTLRSGPGGLLKAMEDLKKHLEDAGLTASQQARVLALAFGGRQATGVQLLIGQLDRLRSKETEIGGGAGQFTSQWDATRRTFKVQMDQLGADMQRIGIQLAVALTPVIPVLVKMAGKIADFVTQMQTGKGAGGQFASALKTAFGIVKTAVTDVYDALGGIKGTIEAIAFGYAASKLLSIASTFRSLGGGLRAVSGSGVAGATAAAASSEVAAAGGGVRGAAGALSMGVGRIFGAAGWLALAAPLGIALTNVVGKWISGNANREGDDWAAKFTHSLGGHISAQVKTGLAASANAAIRTPRPGSQQAQVESGNIHLILNPGQQANPQLFNQAFNKQFDQLYTAVRAAGQKAGETVVQAWGSVKFPTEPLLLQSVDRALNSVPRQITQQGPQWVQLWKDQAAKQMLQYAVTLQQQGKLPLSAVQRLMSQLEAQIPGFSAYLQSQGLASDQAFARVLKFNTATNALKTTLRGYRKDFISTSISINLTGDNINQNVTRAMTHLKTIISTSTGAARKAAVADFNRLKDESASALTAMGAKTVSSVAGMKNAIVNGTGNAAKIAASNMGDFASAVANAVNSGAVSTGQGMNVLISNLNKALKEMGQKQLSPVQVASMTLSAGKDRQLTARGAAHGGLFQIGRPGEAGRDSVPLNVGGMPIAVAPGEQVAVFNRHQLPIVNRALAPMGGLPGLFSKVSRPNYMAAGGMVPGFAGGGTFSYSQLEGLWDKAGGPQNLAPLMAAIALAESGGNASIVNSIGASGLWQIHPAMPGDLDPLQNAKYAVMKYQTQGLSAWETYTNGAYKQYLHGGVAPSLGGLGGSLAQIVAPVVKGGGVIGQITKAAVKLGAKAANAYLSKLAPAAMGTSNAGANLAGLPRGLGSFDGLPVADWIIPILHWASSHGWGGRITSGYRTFQQQANLSSSIKAAAGHSNHELANYPGGAVDVGSPADRADGSALWNVLKNYPGHPNLVWGGPVIGDWGHFSATGHARGGLLGHLPKFAGAFAAGGAVRANGPTLALFGERGPETAMFVPGYAKGGILANMTGTTGPASIGASLSFAGSKSVTPSLVAASAVSAAIGEPKLPAIPRIPVTSSIPSMIAWAGQAQGKITALRAQVSTGEHEYSMLDQFYNLAGSPELLDPNTGELNEPAIQARVDQLTKLIAYRQKIFDTWSQVVVWTEALVVQNQRIVSGLHAKLAATRTILQRLRNTLRSLSTRGLKGNALRSVQRRQKDTQAAITRYSGIEQSTISDVAKYTGNLSSAQGDLISGGDDRDSSWLSLLTDQANRTSIAATQAQPIAASASSASTAASDQTAQLLQTLLTQSQQTVAVSQAQYKVLSQMPPYGGSFADGGVVPGPMGSPRTIIAHGGELVSNSTGGTPQVHLHFGPGMDWLREFIQVEVSQGGRRDSRYALRQLPGSRGR